MSHTPGPWFSDVDGFGTPRIGAFGFDTFDGSEIIALFRTSDGVSFDQAKANTIIARAAPDMFEALKNASGFLDTTISRRRNAGDSFYEETVNSIRAALTKAQGLPSTEVTK